MDVFLECNPLSGNVKGARAYHSVLECVVNTFGVVDMENNLSIK
jgi:hypothetical protein